MFVVDGDPAHHNAFIEVNGLPMKEKCLAFVFLERTGMRNGTFFTFGSTTTLARAIIL